MSARKAIIYVGGSHPQIPGIVAAKEAGLYTVVTDMNADAAGKPYADHFAQVGATDKAPLLALAERISADYQLVGCYGVADYAYAAIGEINQRFNLPGGRPDVYARTNNKSLAKELWQKSGVLTAPSVSVTKAADFNVIIQKAIAELTFPAIVKPNDSYNGQGITIVEQPQANRLQCAITSALKYSDSAIIECYLVGTHINVDMILVAGRSYPAGCTERRFLNTPGSVAFCGIQPSILSNTQQQTLYLIVAEAAKALSLTDGVVTADVIVTSQGPIILEMSPHFHALATNYWCTHRTPLTAWFFYLAGKADWQAPLKAKQLFVGAYCNLVGDREQLAQLMEELRQAGLQIADYIDRSLGENRRMRIAWLLSDSYQKLSMALDQLAQTRVCAT